jgi:hypothetical protein
MRSWIPFLILLHHNLLVSLLMRLFLSILDHVGWIMLFFHLFLLFILALVMRLFILGQIQLASVLGHIPQYGIPKWHFRILLSLTGLWRLRTSRNIWLWNVWHLISVSDEISPIKTRLFSRIGKEMSGKHRQDETTPTNIGTNH